ncbi:MAG: N-6 DNA methylase [Bacteroides sp.]|nr:N-6 DNA methylase [Bacteroides sp.]
MVNFMLDLMGYTPDKDLSQYRILEPSFGCGDFLMEIINRIYQSSIKYHFNATRIITGNVYGCEIDSEKYDKAINRICRTIPDFSSVNLKREDFLLSEWSCNFDFIVGNPPYIRYENIPVEIRDAYKAKFTTFHYRCDIYVLFFEHCLRHLASAGRHCFICSNRWIRNEYGRKLRSLISRDYNLDYLIDIEGIDAFSETVLAYPAITVISGPCHHQPTKTAKIFTLKDLSMPLSRELKKVPENCDLWEQLFAVGELHNLYTIENQGFTIGIGVATGADKIFINSNLISMVEDNLLLPIVNSRDLTDNKFNWKGAYLLNPYKADGSLIDIDCYPKAKRYLEQFKLQLENRHIVKKGRRWYSLIDKVKAELISLPKILLPDISGNRKLFVDKGKFYPAHNIYYITGGSIGDLELLAAILMSDFVRSQIGNISNKMNGGMPRWQSQSIKKLRIPLLSEISSEDRLSLLNAYHNSLLNVIDETVGRIVATQQGSAAITTRDFPKSLFDYEY